MRKITSMLVIVGMLVLMATNCTRHPNEEQLQVLTETKSAAEAAKQKIEDFKLEKAEYEKQLAVKKAELDKANAEKTRAGSAK